MSIADITDKGIELDGGTVHEAFNLYRNTRYGWCKTDRKPYDVVVTAILLRASQLAPKAIRVRYAKFTY
jgi:uncharacterized protein (DUF2461 family)